VHTFTTPQIIQSEVENKGKGKGEVTSVLFS